MSWTALQFQFLSAVGSEQSQPSRNVYPNARLPASMDTNPFPLRNLPTSPPTVEQRVPWWFSFDKDPSQKGHQEQDEGSNPNNGPGTVRSKAGRWSLITINTTVPGISWLLKALAPRAAEGSWKPASTGAPKSCCPLSPACWPLGVTTPQHSQTRNPGPPFLSPSHLCP